MPVTVVPVPLTRWKGRAVALILAMCAGCGEPSGPEASGVIVTVSTSRSTAAPGEGILVTVRAEPVGSHTVRWITIFTTGLVELRDSMPVTGPGPHELVRTITLPLRPLTGVLTITGSASAGAGTVSDQETVDVSDGVAPTIALFRAEPLPAQPGDSTHFNYDVGDAVGVSRITLRVHTAFSAEREITFNPTVLRASGILKILVPNDIFFGPRATAILTVSDESGQFREASVSYDIQDTRPPSVRLVLGGLHADQTIGTGETIQIIAEATDNHQLKYIGYEGGGRRDSVAVNGGSAASRAFPVVIQPAWRQRRPVFSVFARDVSENVTPVSHESVASLPVFDWTEYPKTITPFPNEPTPVDIAWDSRRNVVYQLRSDLDRGINSVIDVIRIPSGLVESTIAVGGRASGLSLTTSGDSLITTLYDDKALGIVDLTRPQRTTAILPLQHIDPDRRPGTARVAGSHVFVPVIHGLYHGRLLDVNLATGTQTIRADIGGTADLTQYPVLLSLSGGRLLLHRESDGYSKNDTFLYDSSPDTFAPITPLPPVGYFGSRQFTLSPSGRMLFGNKVLERDFTGTDTLAVQDWIGEYASALSIDGQAAYLATWYGYAKVRISDGFILEQVKLEMQPHRFLMLPSGNTLVAVGFLPGTNKGEFSLMVIDLR
jgi:hypothetical protein